uniref:Dual specificity protein phosphatase 18 n=1 Tax=Ascaris suum TaxID=6253 RepID=F1L3Y0_ASCSU
MVSLTFRVNPENAKITEVYKGLFVSGICALTPVIINENGITFIINTTEEVPNLKTPSNVQSIKLWIEDSADCNIYAHLEMTANQIQAALSSGGKVLIHSVHGTSRAAAICLAYLLKFKCKSLKDAYERLASKRPQVTPNIGFWRRLIAFEQEVKQTVGSVNIIRDERDPRKLVPDVYAVVTNNAHAPLTRAKKAACCTRTNDNSFAKKKAESCKRPVHRIRPRQGPSTLFQPVLEPLPENAEANEQK